MCNRIAPTSAANSSILACRSPETVNWGSQSFRPEFDQPRKIGVMGSPFARAWKVACLTNLCWSDLIGLRGRDLPSAPCQSSFVLVGVTSGSF